MKKIIICCDGTWNSPDQPTPSNVFKLKSALLLADSKQIRQLVYYDAGIGADSDFIDKYVAGATGMGISKNIRDCYQCLVQQFQPGDQIYCFGFSRGAYTVRSLVGFVSAYGLLTTEQMDEFEMMYQLYRTPPAKRAQHKDFARCEAIRAGSVKPRITFIGVWDTVGALGVPTPMLGWISRQFWVGFHDTELRNTDYAYQALAIDERRKPFRPSVWTKANDCLEMQQVWFAGCHSNVGGGLQDSGLSDTAFAWMLKKAQIRGLEFDQNYLDDPTHLNPDFRGPIEDSYSLAYKVFGPYLRPIGQMHDDVQASKTGVNELIHASVASRYAENLPTFNPDNTRYGLEKLATQTE